MHAIAQIAVLLTEIVDDGPGLVTGRAAHTGGPPEGRYGAAEPVNEDETAGRSIYCSASSLVAGARVSSSGTRSGVAGLLIHTSVGGAPIVGGLRTKRSGWRRRQPRAVL